MNKIICSIFSVFFILNFISCSHNATPDRVRDSNKKMEKKDLYLKGNENYFLSNLPDWANFSDSGECHRTENIHYLNIVKMRMSFNLSYADTMQIQLLFNKKMDELKDLKADRSVSLKDEEMAFYQAKEEIMNGGQRPFIPPTYENVNLIWIDPFLGNSDKIEKLKRVMKEKSMENGHPVFVSFCLKNYQLNQFVEKNNFGDFDIRLISADLFSIYNEKNSAEHGFVLALDNFFKKEQKLFFYLMNGRSLPKELVGGFQVKKII